MVVVKTIARPNRLPPIEAPVPCAKCGEWTIQAERHGPGGVIKVRWCFDGCGAEDPPLRQEPIALQLRRCSWCGAQFKVHPHDRSPNTCSLACADRAAALTARRRSDGRAMRKERAS